MKSKSDVVILGGGIQGLSLAYHLARKGITDISLIEMNTLGSGSSGRSAAIIGFAFQSDRMLAMTMASFSALMSFAEDLGSGPDYEPIGCLLLGGAQSSAELRRRYRLLQKLGVDSQLVDREMIARLTPGLNLEDIEIGLYNAREGSIDPHAIMMAYAGYARRSGADLVENVRATGLLVQGDRVVGVQTTGGTITTACVVNAAGFGAGEVASWAGLDLPITNLKRHIFVTGPVPAYRQSIPFTYDAEVSWYMRREGPGLIIGMGAVESDEEDPQVDWSFLDTVIDHSIHRAPALEQAGVKSGWAGLRPVTPDDDPILGPVPGLEGYWNDCGWGGHGIMHAPAAGMALAEWIADGRASSLDISCFGVERFFTADSAPD